MEEATLCQLAASELNNSKIPLSHGRHEFGHSIEAGEGLVQPAQSSRAPDSQGWGAGLITSPNRAFASAHAPPLRLCCSYSNTSQELFWSSWHINVARLWTLRGWGVIPVPLLTWCPVQVPLSPVPEYCLEELILITPFSEN